MADINSGLGWSEAQWEKVNKAVSEAFEKASVAGAFIPCYGPLPSSAEYVRNEQLKLHEDAKVVVTDDSTLKLFNLTVRVELSSEQVSDDALSTALLAFRRAANTLAQVEDDIVFNGFDPPESYTSRDTDPKSEKSVSDARADRDKKWRDFLALKGGEEDASTKQTRGTVEQIADALSKLEDAEDDLQRAERRKKVARTALIAVTPPTDADGLVVVALKNAPPKRYARQLHVLTLRAKGIDVGEQLVGSIVRAIADLEDDSHPEPFACVMGSNLFDEAYRPVEKSMVLPADRIIPLLKGPLLRSGQMDKDSGIVVSLAGTEIDIVVATPPKVQFLQVTEGAKYVFRVYEKFRLRIKDETAVRALVLFENS